MFLLSGDIRKSPPINVTADYSLLNAKVADRTIFL